MKTAVEQDPELILCDVRMPGMTGLELLEKVVEIDPALPVILISGHGDIAMAVQAMRKGALSANRSCSTLFANVWPPILLKRVTHLHPAMAQAA